MNVNERDPIFKKKNDENEKGTYPKFYTITFRVTFSILGIPDSIEQGVQKGQSLSFEIFFPG